MRFIFCFAVVLLGGNALPAAEIQVVTTTADLASIAREIGGEKLQVRSIAKSYQDPHYVQAKPSYMRLVNRADLLVYIGLQLEVGWLPLLIEGGRNPAIVPGARGLLNASRNIAVLEVHEGEVDRSMGDVHPEGNPHYLLDPRQGLVVAATMAARLAELAPAEAGGFNANLARFQAELEKKILGWERRATSFRGQKIVAYHKQWEYLAAWLGLEIAAYIEDKPGIPTTPRHLSSLIEYMRETQVKVLLCANYVDPGTARRVASKTGAWVLVLPVAATGEAGGERYADLFDMILAEFEKAFGSNP